MNKKLKTLYNRRIKKMCKFLRTKVPWNRFDMSVETMTDNHPDFTLTPKTINKCGFKGCLVGWTPVCFPTLVKYNEREEVELRSKFYKPDSYGILCHLFGIKSSDAADLYYDKYNSISTPLDAAKELEKLLHE